MQDGFDRVLAYVAVRREHEVDWSCFDLKDTFFHFQNCWRTGEVIGLVYKRVHEREPESDGQIVYRELKVPSIAVGFNSDVQMSSLGDAGVVTQEASCDGRLESSPGGAATLVTTVTGDDEGDWTSEIDRQVHPLGVSSVEWVFLAYKACFDAQCCPPRIMVWVYLVLGSVACLTILR